MKKYILVVFLIGVVLSIFFIKKAKSENFVVSWGGSAAGQAGNGDASSPVLLKPAEVILPPNIKEVSAGFEHAVAITEEGYLYAWGANQFGQLGLEGGTEATPKKISDIGDAVMATTDENHSIVLRKDGTVWVTGLNRNGQLGDGTNNDSHKFIQVKNLKNIKKIAAGYRISFALEEDGTLWAWGASCPAELKTEAKRLAKEAEKPESLGGYFDPYGEDFSDRKSESDCVNEDAVRIGVKEPKKIDGLGKVKDVSAGYGHVLILNTEGKVLSFGCNLFGQLGRGRMGNDGVINLPGVVSSLENIVAVSAGFRHSLALRADGRVFGWGDNHDGQVGDGTETDAAAPKEVKNLENISSISAGHDFSLALNKDGSVWAWGENNLRQFLKDEPDESSLPIKLDGLENVKSISAGGTFAVAILEK